MIFFMNARSILLPLILLFIFSFLQACGGGSTTPAGNISLAAPSNLVVTAGENINTLTWPQVANATSYNIYWSNVSGNGLSGTKINSASTSYIHTNLTAGTTYYYVVTAINSSEESSVTAEVSAIPLASAVVIPTPTGLTASPQNDSIVFSWDVVNFSQNLTYNVYWSTTSGSVFNVNKTNVTGASFTHTGISADTTYYYLVTATDGTSESNLPNEVSAIIQSPAAPLGVGATAGNSSVSISFTSNGADSYNIYWSLNSGTGLAGNKINIQANSYTHNNLSEGLNYYYVVTAVKGSLESVLSNEVTAIPLAAPATLADKISELQTVISFMDGSINQTGSFYFSEGLVIHRFQALGRSFCFPSDLFAAANPAGASGTTSIYGCTNVVSLSHQVTNPTTLRLLVTIPNGYTQISGSVEYIGNTYPYLGYAKLTNHVTAYDIAIVNNGNGTYSLGAITPANIYTLGTSSVNSQYQSIIFNTNNSSANQFDLSSSYYIVTQVSGAVWGVMETAISSMGSFVF